MTELKPRRSARRTWVPERAENLVAHVVQEAGSRHAGWSDAIEHLAGWNKRIHDDECLNLNPASNTMSPRATAMLGAGLSPRTSLGYAGEKYEMGLEAIERIEIITAELAARLFDVDHVELRVPSGAMANLFAFMAATRPGDTIITPPATIGGHVTHHRPGTAGLYGLDIRPAPIDAERYTIDTDALAALAERVQPKLITVGSSLNLTVHDVPTIRAIADTYGALVMFDAAHLSGPIAGGAWPNPLAQGAHMMTMSTYKSLAGPTAGLVLTNDSGIAERLDRIAFPGLTANFDVGKTAALGVTLNEWLTYGGEHANTMVTCAARLAEELIIRNVPVHRCGDIATESHAFALDAANVGGGMAVARRLRAANLLTSAIGLPGGEDRGVRLGTNELVRLGAAAEDMAELADLIAAAWHGEPSTVAGPVGDLRSRFRAVCFADPPATGTMP